jgi:hypothetical protein
MVCDWFLHRNDAWTSRHVGRYIIIAVAVILMASAMLYLVDHKSMVPEGPQSSTVVQVSRIDFIER